jgi:hypothetical protein
VAPLHRGREAVLNFGFVLQDSVMGVGEILEAAYGFLEAAMDQTSKAPPRYIGLWNWLWDGILKAGCGADGQAGLDSGTRSG